MSEENEKIYSLNQGDFLDTVLSQHDLNIKFWSFNIKAISLLVEFARPESENQKRKFSEIMSLLDEISESMDAHNKDIRKIIDNAKVISEK